MAQEITVSELHTEINKIDALLTDAHLAIEDRTGKCIDRELTPVYTQLAELRERLKTSVVDL